MAVIILAMVAATLIEKISGSEAAFSLVYHSPVVIVLWAIAAVSGIILVLRSGVKGATLLLHLSFLVILAGALTTHLGSKEGQIYLRIGEKTDSFVCEDGSSVMMPFTVVLEDFEAEYYTGSKAASDYRSILEIDGARTEISMNHIGRVRGYRFYQAACDPDMKGSYVTVSHDPFGIAVTYCGYVMLLLSVIAFFFQKDSGFRRALRRVAAPAAVAFVLLWSPDASARESLPQALPKDVADKFGDLYIYHNDRLTTFRTMARDYSLKAYGKPGYKGLSASQTVTGWLFYYDQWKNVPFKLKPKDRGTATEAEKKYLFNSTASAAAWKIFPYEGEWYSCTDPLPESMDEANWMFIKRVLDLVEESVREQDWAEVTRIVGKIREYQIKTAGDVLPSESLTRREDFYNAIARPSVPAMACITLGLLLFVLFCIRMMRSQSGSPKWVRIPGYVVGAAVLCYLTLALALRWSITGHVPMSNGHEIMMAVAWTTMLLMMVFSRKFALAQPFGFTLAGFCMLVSMIGGSNPQITQLMPVLSSPLLSIHVTSMMISYSLFGVVMLNGIMGVIAPKEASGHLRDVALVILYPAVFCLALGTFLGAVWANVSWGSYWGWDPKEVWALITMLVYAAALHSGSLGKFRSPRFFHWYCIAAFLCVLITYFGVNLLLGGMHSYA